MTRWFPPLPMSAHVKPLRVSLDVRWAIAFVALLFVHNEIHEIAHTAVGRVICGAWGPRNFNSWRVACQEITPELVLVPLAGLVFSYGLMWIGYRLLRPDESTTKRSLGFCLVFAAMPFGRILTVAQSAGDEMVILRGVFPGINSFVRLMLGVTVVLVLVCPPLFRALSALPRRQRWLVFPGFLLIPYILFETLVLRVANPLLEQGILAGEGLLGAPLFVNAWTGFWLLVLAVSWQYLLGVLVPSHNTTASQ